MDGRQGVATAGDGECVARGDGSSHPFGPSRELGMFEYADRPVPQDGARPLQTAAVFRRRARANIQNHVICPDLVDGPYRTLGGLVQGTGYDHIRRQGHVGRAEIAVQEPAGKGHHFRLVQ